MKTVRPDPKPRPRIHDSAVTRRAVRRWPMCPLCGEPSASGHHVLSKGQRGDDVIENVVALCGDGVLGCHGLVTRRDRATLEKLGIYIVAERRDFIEYLWEKIGRDRVVGWLERNLLVPPDVGRRLLA